MRRWSIKVALAASILSPFIVLSSDMLPWQGTSRFTMLLHEIVYPFEYSWNAVTSFVSDTWQHYFYLVDAAKNNELLKSENAKLKARSIDYEELFSEISRLRKLLGFVEHHEKKLIVAEVVSIPHNSSFQSIRINRGELSGVRIGMPVVTADGVIGRVIRTGLNSSDLQLLTDLNFNLDVLLQRTRVRGVLRGLSGNYCALNLHRRAEIRIGDTIITSGILGGFPKGLPVGRVMRISYESDNVTQIITVEPWVDHKRVEEVFVIEQGDQELKKILETAGRQWLEKSILEAERNL